MRVIFLLTVLCTLVKSAPTTAQYTGTCQSTASVLGCQSINPVKLNDDSNIIKFEDLFYESSDEENSINEEEDIVTRLERLYTDDLYEEKQERIEPFVAGGILSWRSVKQDFRFKSPSNGLPQEIEALQVLIFKLQRLLEVDYDYRSARRTIHNAFLNTDAIFMLTESDNQEFLRRQLYKINKGIFDQLFKSTDYLRPLVQKAILELKEILQYL